jgi:hypothetical protein
MLDRSGRQQQQCRIPRVACSGEIAGVDSLLRLGGQAFQFIRVNESPA